MPGTDCGSWIIVDDALLLRDGLASLGEDPACIYLVLCLEVVEEEEVTESRGGGTGGGLDIRQTRRKQDIEIAAVILRLFG